MGKMQYKHSTCYFFIDQNDQNIIIAVSVNMINNDTQAIVAFDSKLKYTTFYLETWPEFMISIVMTLTQA